jgi:hypothetical protein
MRRDTYAAAVLMLLAGGLVLCRPAVAADAVPAARRLPSNTFVHLTIPSVDELKKRWDESAIAEIREDRALADFREDIEALLEEASARVKEHVGLTLEELLEIPSGEFAIAVSQLPGQKFGAVGFLEFGDSEDKVDRLLDQAAQALERKDAERRVEEFEGTRIVVYTLASEDAAEGEEGAEPKELAYFVKDTTLVAGNGLPVLQEVLERWDGESNETLAADNVYNYIVQQTETRGRPALLRWYLNPIDLMRAVVMAGAQGNPQVAMAFGFLPALGLDKFKAVGGGLDMATGEFESVSRTLLYVDQPPTGLLNVFQFPATDLSPPRWVPAAASTYFALNWDVAGAYRAVGALVDTFQGPGAFDQMVEGLSQQGPGIHVKRDIIDLMTGKVHVYSTPPKETVADDGEVEVPIENFLVAIGVKDAQKARDLLKTLSESADVETRQFQGETIYEMASPAGLGNAEATFGLAVARDSLLATNNVTVLEQMLREGRGGTSLGDSTEYKRVARHFPAKTSMLSFARQETQVKALYEMLRNGQIGQDIEGVDFSKLPPFEQVQKYLPLSGSYTVPDKQGALFVNFSLSRDR